MQYRIKVPPWCFPALNHVLRLLQNNSCKWRSGKEMQGQGQHIPSSQSPWRGMAGRQPAAGPCPHWGSTKVQLICTCTMQGAKGAALISAPKSHMSVPEAPFRAFRGNPRMGHAAAVARGRVPEPPSHSCSRMQPSAVIQIRSRRLLSNCQSVLFSKQLYM